MSPWDSRKNNFDFLRLALAVLVIYSHAFPLGLGTEAAEPFHRWTHGQLTGGAVAVDSFFIMSGFLIAASAERSRGVLSFLKKRFTRIYPAFLVSAVLTAVLVVPLAGAHYASATVAGRVGDFLLQTLRLVEFHYVNAFARNPFPGVINGSVWSVSYEFWCYIGVAILMMAGLLRRRSVVAVLFVAAWVVGIAFRVEGWLLGGKMLGAVLGPPQFWARLLPLYLAGVAFYSFREKIPLRGWTAALSAAALVGACWFQAGFSVAFPVAGTYLLFWFAFEPRIRLHRAGQFGDFSYGTYLYAFPIEQLLMQHFGGIVSPWVLFASATPPTLIAAVCSWYGVERPFLQPGRRKETVAHAVMEHSIK